MVGFTAREHKRIKTVAGRLQKEEAQDNPDIERLLDRAAEANSKAKKKARRKTKLRGRRAAPTPTP